MYNLYIPLTYGKSNQFFFNKIDLIISRILSQTKSNMSLYLEKHSEIAICEDPGKGGKPRPTYFHYCELKKTFKKTSKLHRIITMSDLHSVATKMIGRMINSGLIDSKTLVIATGDMSGTGTYGSNGNPLPDFEKIRDSAYALYFVHGNHDYHRDEAYEMINKDKTPCCVDQIVTKTIIGKIGGVNGIIAKRGKKKGYAPLHIYKKEEYMKRLDEILDFKPDILLTHQPIDVGDKAKIHMFGHDIAEKYVDDKDGRLRLHMDSRIFIFE